MEPDSRLLLIYQNSCMLYFDMMSICVSMSIVDTCQFLQMYGMHAVMGPFITLLNSKSKINESVS